jgi:hypothetical protein
MRIFKLSALLVLSTFSFVAISQEKKEEPKQAESKSTKSNGNADAMRRNLNYPNAVNPATNNIQKYDRGNGRVESDHPKENLGNSYTRKNYEGKK